MDRIAVLVPCFNEEQTIGRVVADFRQTFPDAVIYVYDNNSTDATAARAEKAGAVVRYEFLQGKGNVIRRMFQEVNAECYILVDGDDTYPAQAAPAMARLVLERQVDMVVGDRLSSTYFQENQRPFHNLGNRLVRASINRVFRSNIRDIMTGYRAFSFRFVKTFPVLSQGFEIETEMTIHAISMNMAIENIVVDYRDRPAGSQSKLDTFSDGRKVMLTIFNLYRGFRPLQFFSLLGWFLLLAAAAVFVPVVLIPYYHTGLVENFPTLIVCGFVGMASLMSFFNGMVLDAIHKKERREFEFRLVAVGYFRQYAQERKTEYGGESNVVCDVHKEIHN